MRVGKSRMQPRWEGGGNGGGRNDRASHSLARNVFGVAWNRAMSKTQVCVAAPTIWGLHSRNFSWHSMLLQMF